MYLIVFIHINLLNSFIHAIINAVINMKTIVIVGGGASGLIASIYAKNDNTEVILLERNKECGKKLLATGNGRCNYWNSNQDLSHYNSNNKELLGSVITSDNQKEIMDFFYKIGIIPKIKNDYYYPYSNQAQSIKDALIVEAKKKGVKIYNDCFVSKIAFKNKKFIINSNIDQYVSDCLIIATGSKASPKTGSDGNGYNLISQLSHSIIEPLPALVQLRGNEKYFKDWAGIRSDVKIKLYSNDQFIKEETGEIQLTDYGISGICTFNLSRFVSRNLKENKKQYVYINFLPFLNTDIYEWFNQRATILENRNIFELLEGVLNNKLITVILQICKIDLKKTYQDLNNAEKKLLIEKITNFKLEITGTNSFDQAQVCSGGVPLTEININTMESKFIKDLYIVGELLDVDGECGGYNLSFAWISGMLAGKSSREINL